MDTTKVPGHTRLYPDRIDLDTAGRPLLVAAGVGGIGYDTHILRWEDFTWVVLANLGYGTAFSHPVSTIGADYRLMWQTLDDIYSSPYRLTYLVMGEFDGTRFARLDTVARVWNGNFAYSGAASARRRWAVKSEYGKGVTVWYSDTIRTWREVGLPGYGDQGNAAGVLDDTTALVAWKGLGEGVRWGLLRGSTWLDGGLVPRPLPNAWAQAPRLRRSPSGALWMAWSTDHPYVQFATFRDGAWTLAESLQCEKRVPGDYASKTITVSRDGWERPVIAWVEHDAHRGFMGILCVAVPNDSGYLPAEDLEGTDDALVCEAVRDRNGDVWLVWQTEDDGLFWTHSYTRAICDAPSVTGSGRTRVVAWRLSEPAPETWWAVLRAHQDGPFEEAARVRAGPGLDLSWSDTSPAKGHVRYTIRRECLDRRFEWLSEEGRWPAKSRKPLLSLLPRPLDSSAVPCKVEQAAAGLLQIELYDIQGRRLLRRTEPGPGLDMVSTSLDLTQLERRLTSGIYFLRVTDAAGQQSEATKVVVLR